MMWAARVESANSNIIIYNVVDAALITACTVRELVDESWRNSKKKQDFRETK